MAFKRDRKREAFAAFVREHQASLRSFLRGIGVQADSVDDLAQETFMAAYRELDRFDDNEDFGKWLRGIARNMTRNELRKNARRSCIMNEELTQHLLAKAEVDECEARFEDADLCALRDCLEQLPEKSRSLIAGYDKGEIHWQFKNDGSLSVGVHHPNGKHNYSARGFMDLSQLGTWFHLATIFDQKEGTLSHYLNGELFAVKELKGTGQLNFGEASIGNWDQPVNEGKNSVRGLNGRMAEMMVFKEAISAEEMKRLALR